MVLEELYSDLWLEFLHDDLCGLCANRGMMPACLMMTNAGRTFLRREHYCICPNGRALKEAHETGTVGGNDASH